MHSVIETDSLLQHDSILCLKCRQMEGAEERLGQLELGQKTAPQLLALVCIV